MWRFWTRDLSSDCRNALSWIEDDGIRMLELRDEAEETLRTRLRLNHELLVYFSSITWEVKKVAGTKCNISVGSLLSTVKRLQRVLASSAWLTAFAESCSSADHEAARKAGCRCPHARYLRAAAAFHLDYPGGMYLRCGQADSCAVWTVSGGVLRSI